MGDCRYCDDEYQSSDRTVVENQYWFGNFDIHPVSPGHMKIIPKRHVDRFIDLDSDELLSLCPIIGEARNLICENNPDGYNIQINEGEAAGQTVFHLHIHLIPRYKGDVVDFVGGARNILYNGK